jgi:phosphonate transport system ATP-binding protein
LLGLLGGLCDEDDRTLVASLHSPGLARRHFDRIIGLRHGRIVLDGPSADVVDADLEHLYSITEAPESREVTSRGHEGSAPPR